MCGERKEWKCGRALEKKAFQLCPGRHSPSTWYRLRVAEGLQVAAGAALVLTVKSSAVNLDQKAIRNI